MKRIDGIYITPKLKWLVPITIHKPTELISYEVLKELEEEDED